MLQNLKTPASSRTRAFLSFQMRVALVCLAIVAAGAAMRLAGTDWDRGSNLHPDERHMMFTVMSSLDGFQNLDPNALSAGEVWFDTGRSPLNPRRNEQFYVYGDLPHIVMAFTAMILGRSGWPEIMLLARTVGSALDAYTILAVFLLTAIGTRNAAAGLFAAGLYAFAPIAIQNANFFTVDVWLTAAGAWCLVAATMMLRNAGRGGAKLGWIVLTGVLAGLAAACKLPGLALVGVLVLAILLRHLREGSVFSRAAAANLAIGLMSAFAAYRVACPFSFQGPGILGLLPNEAVIEGYRQMSGLMLSPYFPPNWQWFSGYSRADAVFDLATWGLGPAISLAVAIGIAMLPFHAARQWPFLLPTGAFGAVLAAYWLSGSIFALRYMLPTVVVLCAIGGMGLGFLRSPAGRVFSMLVVLAAGLWGLGMVRLHTETNSRIAASAWLWAETKPGTVIANESPWDDGLPVSVRRPNSTDLLWPAMDGHFRFVTLYIDTDDNPDKARSIAERLDEADFMAISSERMRKPILALGQRFPMTAAYYAMLAGGELCFERVFEQRPGYTVLGYTLDDSGAQETWSVYDHPAVEIYRKRGCYDAGLVEQRLLQALPSGS